MLTFGGGLALGVAMVESGTADWVVTRLGGLADLPPFVGVVAVAAVALLMTTAASNTAAAATLIPLAVPLAGLLGVDPVCSSSWSWLATSIDFALVIGTPPTMMAYSTDLFTPADILRPGWPLDLAGLVLLVTVVLGSWVGDRSRLIRRRPTHGPAANTASRSLSTAIRYAARRRSHSSGLGDVEHVAGRLQELGVGPTPDLGELPLHSLEVLGPLEVRHDDSPGVGQDVRDHHHAPLDQSVVGFGGDRALAPSTIIPAATSRRCPVDAASERGGHEDVTARRQQVGCRSGRPP